MTIKELAELTGVSKTTIQRALKELDIKPSKTGNRYIIDSPDIYKIIEKISPTKVKEIFDTIEQNGIFDADTIEINDFIAAKLDANATENKANAPQTATNETKLIEMLEKSLDEKESTIKAQQNTIDELIKEQGELTENIKTLVNTNTALAARISLLEDNQGASNKDIIIDDAASNENKENLSLWQKIKAVFI